MLPTLGGGGGGGLNPRPPGLQSDSASNWATVAGVVGMVLRKILDYYVS